MSRRRPTEPPVAPGDFSHVCFAVPDIEDAITEITAMTGFTFGAPVHDRLGAWPYSIAFSAQAPHIELISSTVGSPWETDVPRFHHLGWWSTNLPETITAWTDAGATVCFDGREHARRFVYADAPRSGVRLEAVDAAQRAGFLARWTSNPAR